MTSDAQKKIQRQDKLIKLEELKPYEFNNRNHPQEQVEQIAKSLQEFGWTNPILVDENLSIIAGHGRWQGAKHLGMTEAPCVILSGLTEEKKRAYRILDNKLTEDSTWAMDNLSLEVGWLEDQGFDVAEWGLDELVEDWNEEQLEAEDDGYTGEVPDETFLKKGDLLELGGHRVLCGDSTSAEDVAELMQGKKAELLFTSPPYSDMREYDSKSDAILSASVLSDFIPIYSKVANYCAFNLGIQRKDHNIVEYWNVYLDKGKDSYKLFLAWNVWAKGWAGGVGMQTAFIPIAHEWVFVFGNKFKDINRCENRKSAFRDQSKKMTRRQKDGSMKRSSIGEQEQKKEMESVSFFNCEMRKEITKSHPAVMGMGLAEQYIAAITNKRQLVADPFLGSGTTLIAADQLGRICYGMEISPQYCQVILDRYIAHCAKSNKKADVRINGEVYNPVS